MSSNVLPQHHAVASTRLYRAVWRWHFYAGLLIVPFLVTLAISGLIILWVTGVSPEYGDWVPVQQRSQALSVAAQAEKALAAHPAGKVSQYIAPWSAEYPALVRVDLADGNRMLAIDPYSGEILLDRAQSGTWNEFVTNIHGELLIGGNGGPGDFVVEIAASLGVIMVVSGLYLWWPRNDRKLASALMPRFSLSGRARWKSLHESIGAWMSIVLLFFLLSGLAWAGVWGGKMVQAWSTFPAEKWDNVPLSDETHASMNHGATQEVPCTLEPTPMPQSGSGAGLTGLPPGTPVVLETIASLGRSIGFEGRFQIAVPSGAKGVWPLRPASMSYDSTNPMADRPVHVDQYTGKILADVRFIDYPFFGKLMAVGIALHEGQLGWWNVALNALFCLTVIFTCISGIVMWWSRRPSRQLAAPRYPSNYSLTHGVALIAIILGAVFPLAGLAIVIFAVIDFLLPKRFKEAGFQNLQ